MVSVLKMTQNITLVEPKVGINDDSYLLTSMQKASRRDKFVHRFICI